MLNTHLKPTAKTQFIKTILRGALRADDKKDDVASPIHTLRLARALVAACAGCWAKQGFAPPLDENQLTTLVEIYWQA